MAQETFNKLINIQVDDKSLSQLESTLSQIDTEIVSLNKALQDTNKTLEEQTNIQKQLNSLNDKKKEVSSRKEILALEEKGNKARENAIKKSEQLFKTVEGLAGSLQIATAASSLFGQKTAEQVQAAADKVILLVGLTDGIKKSVEGGVAGYNLLNNTIKKLDLSSKLFGTSIRAAVTATGIGGIAIILGLIISNFDKIKEFFGGAGKSQFTKDLEAQNLLLDKEIAILEARGIPVFQKREERINNEIKLINKRYDEELKRLGDVSERAEALADLEGTRTLNTAEKRKQFILEQEKILSEGLLSIKEELNKQEIELDKNTIAFRLNIVEEQFKKEKLLIDTRLKDQAITENTFNQQIFQLQKKLIEDKINLNKEFGKSTTELEDELVLLEISNNKRKKDIREKDLQELNDANDKFRQEELQRQLDGFTKEELKLQESLINKKISYEDYQKEVEINELKLLNFQLDTVEEGGTEYLAIQKQINDKKIQENQRAIQKQNDDEKKLVDEQLSLQRYLFEQQKQNENDIINNTKNTFRVRKDAVETLKNLEIERIENEKQILKDQENTVEYVKLQDAQVKATEDANKKIADLTAERFRFNTELIFKFAQASVQLFSGIIDFLNVATDNQIKLAEDRITKFEEDSDKIKEQIDANKELIDQNNSLIEENLNRINELEGEIANQRGARFEQTKQELEDERVERNKLMKNQEDAKKQSDKLAKAQIENEKKIQAEKDKIEKLEIERKKRAKIQAITQATISTAQAVVGALGNFPFSPANIILASIVGAAGALQLATISAQQFEDGGVAGFLADGPSHAEGGIPGRVAGRTPIEFEGGEAILNKRSTAMFRPILSMMNQAGGGKPFEFGGTTDFASVNSLTRTTNNLLQEASEQTFVISVEEINRVQTRVNVIENDSAF